MDPAGHARGAERHLLKSGGRRDGNSCASRMTLLDERDGIQRAAEGRESESATRYALRRNEVD